jgi:hypothetical protein
MASLTAPSAGRPCCIRRCWPRTCRTNWPGWWRTGGTGPAPGATTSSCPCAGLAGEDRTAGQRELLLALTDPTSTRCRRLPAPHGARRWAGTSARRTWPGSGLGRRAAPFYFRLHRPVLLIGYDNHPGIFRDNAEP